MSDNSDSDHYDDLSDLSDHDINNNDINNNDNNDDNDTNEEVNRDPFGDDAHLLQLRIEASSLTLDEVGYDRDLNRINNPTLIDRKTLFKATILRKQVDQIKGIVTPEDLERIKNGEKKSRSRRRKGGVDDRNNNNIVVNDQQPTNVKREIYEAPTNNSRRRNGNVDATTNPEYDMRADKARDRRRHIPNFDQNIQNNNNTLPTHQQFEEGHRQRRSGKSKKDKKKNQPMIFKGIMQNPNRDIIQSKPSYNNLYLNPAAPEFTPPMLQQTAVDYADNTLFLNPAAPEFKPQFAKA